MTNNENSSNSLSKSSSKNVDNASRTLSNLPEQNYPYSQAYLNNSFSMAGSKMAMYNCSASSEYYNQQISILEMQQALRIQDE